MYIYITVVGEDAILKHIMVIHYTYVYRYLKQKLSLKQGLGIHCYDKK